MDLAQRALADLKGLATSGQSRVDVLREALERVANLRKDGKEQEAKQIIQALEELYRDDSAAQVLLKSAREAKNK